MWDKWMHKCSTHIDQMRAFVLRAPHLPESQSRMRIAPGPTTRKAGNSALYPPPILTIIPTTDQEVGTLLQ